MASIKFFLSAATLAAAISFQLLTSNQKITGSWAVAQTFQPPNRGAPAGTAGSATRSGACVPLKQKQLTVLVPESNLGLTISEHPTFFAYFPKSTGAVGEFILMDGKSRVIYRKSFALPSQPGIVSISHPTTERPLEVGKAYRWWMVIVCDDVERSKNSMASGWIERIKPSQNLANQIKNAPPETLSNIYANAGIWYEALANSIALRRQQPNNTKITENWIKLLNSDSVKLGAFVQEPLLDCCQVKQ